MKAEKQAEELIQKAKENRNSKLKQAKDSADEEVKKFRETVDKKDCYNTDEELFCTFATFCPLGGQPHWFKLTYCTE